MRKFTNDNSICNCCRDTSPDTRDFRKLNDEMVEFRVCWKCWRLRETHFIKKLKKSWHI